MSKLSLGPAILLLSSVWMVAEINTAPSDQNPTDSSQRAQQPEKPQTATKDKSAQTVEGCLSGGANVFTLTDATGKTYELLGDTSMLNDNVGHQVRLSGRVDNSGGGGRISATGPQALFNVKKVESLSPTCK